MFFVDIEAIASVDLVSADKSRSPSRLYAQRRVGSGFLSERVEVKAVLRGNGISDESL